MDMMENATQRLQTGLGMRMKLTTIMKAEVTNTDWMDCKKMVEQWSEFQNFFHSVTISYLGHYFQVLVNVDEVGVKHRHLKADALERIAIEMV